MQDSGLAALCQQHRTELLRFLVARTGNPAEAEDLVQELWIKAHAVDSGPVGNGRAYLYRMAQNLVLDRARAARRRTQRDQAWSDLEIGTPSPGGEVADPARNAEDALTDAQEVRRLATAIDDLPDGARRAFCMHKFEGMTHAEVAERLGITRSGVEKHIAVAMAHLRRAITD